MNPFQVQRMEQLAREKEEKFSEERKFADRKTELNDLLRDILGEERKVRSCNVSCLNVVFVALNSQKNLRRH